MDLSHLPDITVLMTGGSLSGAWFALLGDATQRNTSEMFFDKAFIGVAGAHVDHGMTTNYPDQGRYSSRDDATSAPTHRPGGSQKNRRYRSLPDLAHE